MTEYFDFHFFSLWASLIAQLVKNPPQMQATLVDTWVRNICWGRDRLPTPVFLGSPGGSAAKDSACNVGDLGLIPGLGRSPGEGKGYPLQCLAWRIPWTLWGHKESDTTEQLSLTHSLCRLSVLIYTVGITVIPISHMHCLCELNRKVRIKGLACPWYIVTNTSHSSTLSCKCP